MKVTLEDKSWFQYLEHSQQDLAKGAFILLEREQQSDSSDFHDYSFIVFSLSKAYEGFLKKYFFELGIITDRSYKSNHYRIGKSLNPDLPIRYRRDDWVVSKLDKVCSAMPQKNQGEKLSRLLWKAWKECRNLLFHYFPKHQNFINLKQAEEKLNLLTSAMELAVSCKALISNKN